MWFACFRWNCLFQDDIFFVWVLERECLIVRIRLYILGFSVLSLWYIFKPQFVHSNCIYVGTNATIQFSSNTANALDCQGAYYTTTDQVSSQHNYSLIIDRMITPVSNDKSRSVNVLPWCFSLVLHEFPFPLDLCKFYFILFFCLGLDRLRIM